MTTALTTATAVLFGALVARLAPRAARWWRLWRMTPAERRLAQLGRLGARR